MAKGKNKTCSKLEKIVVQHQGSSKETKENKPEMSQDLSKAPPTIQSLLSPNKSRSPLSDHSSVLIQEGNGSDKCHIDTSNLKKGRPNEVNSESRDSKEQNSRRTCPVPGSSEPVFERQQKDSISKINPGPAPDNVSVSKTGRGTRHKIREKKTENKASQNRKVTDYFPIRRSSRKTKAELMVEEHQHLDDLIKNGVEEGLQVQNIEGKGRGVFALRKFKKGDFVVEYHGDLLELTDAKEREAQYAQDPNTGCYMYYFQYHCKTFCVDATKETNRLGRLINHSKIGNCQTKLHGIDGRPHLILVASRDIEAEEELLYDYGDRSKASISAHPWLKY